MELSIPLRPLQIRMMAMRKISLFAAGFYALASMAHAETPVLNVLTYDSFTSEWGPGPAVEAAFEPLCACDLVFQGAGDGAALLARIQLEGVSSDVDVVLGLDTSLTEAARATGLFAALPDLPAPDLPISWQDVTFAPFDWGWFAFVYDNTKLNQAPQSFVELAASGLKIVIQDPRSSTPGLGLLLWVKAAYGDGAAQVWADLADNIVTVTPDWSQSYGMFLAGEVDMVLSYTTSPAYHLIAESDTTKSAAKFSEGHYMQVEVAGKLAATDQPKLADQFLAFMISPAFQNIIPQTNWMYPAHALPQGLPSGFEKMITPNVSLLMSSQQAFKSRDPALNEWRAALSR
ncbi:MAG: thiamine transport system substrate-binding protein [Paracoccaceae bacterium]|jgi:thiamine transport system substrate-binding protein